MHIVFMCVLYIAAVKNFTMSAMSMRDSCSAVGELMN